MITFFQNLLALLFFIKLAWNMAVPVFAQLQKNNGKPLSAISLAPVVEAFLLLSIVITLFARHGRLFGFGAGAVLAIGMALIGLSYLVSILVGRYMRQNSD